MSDPHALCIPTVHLNGTSKEELIAQLRGAIVHAIALKDLLHDAMPHDRDYYVQGEGLGIRARMQMKVRILKVETIVDDLMCILQKVQEQGEKQ
jgi:hypothetical protein